MNHVTERTPRRRVFRLEGLEDRNLLSHLSPTAEVRAAATPTPASTVQGKLIGTLASAPLTSTNLLGFSGLSGHGNATHLSAVLFGTSFKATPSLTVPTVFDISSGSAILTSNIGDQINIVYVGSAVTNVTRSNTNNIALEGYVLSGTNRFDGFTGTFSAIGHFDTHTHRFKLAFAIDLIPPTL